MVQLALKMSNLIFIQFQVIGLLKQVSVNRQVAQFINDCYDSLLESWLVRSSNRKSDQRFLLNVVMPRAPRAGSHPSKVPYYGRPQNAQYLFGILNTFFGNSDTVN